MTWILKVAQHALKPQISSVFKVKVERGPANVFAESGWYDRRVLALLSEPAARKETLKLIEMVYHFFEFVSRVIISCYASLSLILISSFTLGNSMAVVCRGEGVWMHWVE